MRPMADDQRGYGLSSYLCGLDIGGTFTDCVLIDETGQLTIAKAPSTPGNFAAGVIAAIEQAAEKVGLDMPGLLTSIRVLAHGTTVGTNSCLLYTSPSPRD